MNKDLASALCGVYERLEYLTKLIAEGDEACLAALAETEWSRLLSPTRGRSAWVGISPPPGTTTRTSLSPQKEAASRRCATWFLSPTGNFLAIPSIQRRSALCVARRAVSRS